MEYVQIYFMAMMSSVRHCNHSLTLNSRVSQSYQYSISRDTVGLDTCLWYWCKIRKREAPVQNIQSR